MNPFRLDDVPVQTKPIHKDRIKELTLLCTPLTMNGVHLLDNQSLSVFNQCTGFSSIAEIIQSTGLQQEKILGTIDTLRRNGLIEITNQKPKKTEETKSPLGIDVWFHITNRCNLSCPYCYVRKTKESMQEEVAYKVIDNVVKSALSFGIYKVSLKFSGGEPLLCFPLIKKLVSYGKKQGDNTGIKIKFYLLTNGTLITKEIAVYLKKENFVVSLSLDGINNNHNRLRHYKDNRGTFGRIEQGIKILESFDVHPHILTTITALNLSGLPELTSYLLEKKFYFRFSLYREMNTQKESLKSHNEKIIRSLYKCYDIIENNLPEEDFSLIHKLCSINLRGNKRRACGIGVNGICINHHGGITICQSLLDKPVGHIATDNIITAIRNQNQFPALQYSIDDYEHCGDCRWRYLCAGGCPILTKIQYGIYNTYSPYCEVFKECIPRLIKIVGMQLFRKTVQNRYSNN